MALCKVAGAVGGLALGQGLVVEQVDALHLTGRFETAGLEDGRGEVDAVSQLGAFSWLHFAWPSDRCSASRWHCAP